MAASRTAIPEPLSRVTQIQAEKKRRLQVRADVRGGNGLWAKVLDEGRRLRWRSVGAFRHPPREREWILTLFYHWVLDDERLAFQRQLEWLRGYGDIINLDDAVGALESTGGIGGRYFCITFDDGFKNCVSNAMPILKDLEVPAAFFVPTKYIGLNLDSDWAEIEPFYRRSYTEYPGYFEFMDWDDCRRLLQSGFTIGSHTHSHVRLADTPPDDVQQEFSCSKRLIEEQLGISCRHFCCPWGKAIEDFDPSLHPAMARQSGYVSFLTTEPGCNTAGNSSLAIKRIGADPDSDLRYNLFSSRGMIRV